ncbi:MAG: FAD-dependent oxidoreductase [Acidobacteria bacterium]|nr:FAD-dependent oxidoreductase [Acidobacteriota bacterium]
MDKKIGVYVCTGCDIGTSLKVEALNKIGAKGAVCRQHAQLCGPEGSALIRNDIEKEGVNTVLVAACSPREHTGVFNYDPTKVSLERVSLRELVVWSHPANDEDTQALAEDYLRMGLVKAQKMLPVEPLAENTDRTILVVGGGVTGLTAALEAARAGQEVLLLEKDAKLGGWMAKLHKRYPFEAPYTELQPTGIEDLVKQVASEKRIRVVTGTKIEKTSGGPGLFDVTFAHDGTSETVRVGAIVEAVGGRPYEGSKLPHLGYGRLHNVVTSLEFEEMAAKGKFERPADGGTARSVAFIQCAGSRDPAHLPYCSTHCCMTSLKQARYYRDAVADGKVYIVYKDMRTPAQYEQFYKKTQEDVGIFLTKGEVVEVADAGSAGVKLTLDHTPLGEKIEIQADLVVLATGMVPATAVAAPGKAAPPPPPPAADAKKEDEAPKDVYIASDVLNLQYRQGPEPPILQFGFPDSHYICFPYESRRTGVYPAGTVRAPMDAADCALDAAGAALKAIQCAALTAQGKAVHPRTGDMGAPELYMSRCTQCKRCTEECPFGTYNEDEKGNPVPNLTRCRRCAICMGSCPERIISFKDYSVDIVGSVVKAIDVPPEDEEKPRIVAFICENDAYPAADLAARKHMAWSPHVRVIPLRCLGNINLVWIADALSKGIDGVLLIGCKYGEDYQCHFIKGSELAGIRMSKIKETLQRLALESDRIRVLQLSLDEFATLPGIFDDFAKKVEELGPNPYKM